MTSSILHHHDSNNEEKNDNFVNSKVDHDKTKTKDDPDGDDDDAPFRNHVLLHTPKEGGGEEVGVEHNDDESRKAVQALQTLLEHRHPTSIATIVQPDYWPPRNRQMKNYYDWSLPTHEVYKYYDHNDNNTDTNDDRGSDEKEEMEDHDHDHHQVGTAAPTTAAIIEAMCQRNYSNDTKHDKDGGVDSKEEEQEQMLFTPCSLTINSF